MIDSNNDENYGYDDTQDRHQMLDASLDNLKKLDAKISKLNKKMSELVAERELVIDEIIACTGHEHHGQKSHEHGSYNIVISTPYTYKIDTANYQKLADKLPSDFNAVEQEIKTTFKVNKKEYEEFMAHADSDQADIIGDIITEKPGKRNVTIKDRKL